MDYTITEALKEIGKFFPHIDLEKLEGIKYGENSKRKFILTFGRYEVEVNLDDVTYKLI